MKKKRQVFLMLAALMITSLSGVILLLPTILIRQETQGDIHQSENAPTADMIVVLGASVYKDKPSSTVERRLETAISLARAGKAETIVLLGYSDGNQYNEPKVMREYLEKNLPATLDINLIEDTNGGDTYESCYRLSTEYKNRSVLIVTQKFHLHRAVFICSELEVKTEGVVAINAYQYNRVENAVREVFASWKALFELFVLH